MEQQAKYAVEHTRIRADAEPMSRPARGATRADNRPADIALRKITDAMDGSPHVVAQRKLAEALDNSPRVMAQRKLAEAMNSGPRIAREQGSPQVQFAPTALQPVQLSALADARGTDIHVAPVREHLPHEAWHVVQQAPRRNPLAQNHEPIQRAKKKRKQRPPSFKQREAQSQRDKEAAAYISPIQDPDENAWAKSVAATQPVIPVGYQPAKKGVVMDEGMDANTSFAKNNINVTYNTEAASGKRNKRIGQLANTFTHELAVHGKNPPQRDVEGPDEEEEHSAMHHPATRNEYRDLSLAAHDSLENFEQKKAYARSWLYDMNFQISGDEGLGKGEKLARRKWARSQKARMAKQATQLRSKQGLAGRVVQRAIRRDKAALGAEIYNSGYDDGDELSLDTFLEELFDHAPALRASEEKIRELVSSCATEAEPDFAFDTYASVVEWLENNGVRAAEEAGEEEGSSDQEEDEDSEGTGQTVGKLFFPGQEYHQTVKPAVIRTIGAKTLSRLVYGDKTHKNFNFWFEKDGSIFAEVNSARNSKGKDTGYRWVDGACVRK